MLKTFRAISLLITLMMTSIANAYTANELVDDMHTEASKLDALMFVVGWRYGFVMGTVDATPLETAKNPDTTVCIPEKASNGVLLKVIDKYASDNPHKLHEKAGLFLYMAFRSAYPCSKTQ